jgi:hypothetical protein
MATIPGNFPTFQPLHFDFIGLEWLSNKFMVSAMALLKHPSRVSISWSFSPPLNHQPWDFFLSES